MVKIKIISVGKNKEDWLDRAIAEYEKRLTGKIVFEFVWVKDDKSLLEQVLKEPLWVSLDPAGKQLSSGEFASFVAAKGSRLAFVIGGPEGLPQPLRKGELLSLSKMTFTHQMARLILVEQIYRGFTISEGIPYHK